MASIPSIPNHNQRGIMEPLEEIPQWNLLIEGLNNCILAHAFRANPVINKQIIMQFWFNAEENKEGDDGRGTIISNVNGVDIEISESTIREVLQIADSPDFPTSLPVPQILRVFKMMGYPSGEVNFLLR